MAIRTSKWSILAIVGICCFLANFVQIGADWDWLIALGDHIRSAGAIPDGVPFAVADTSGWHNVPALAQVIASVAHDLGRWATGVLHLGLLAVGLMTLATAVRRWGVSDARVASGLILVVLGALPALAIVRAQTWSLLFFPILLSLILAQANRPDRRIWWAPVIIAIWGNLHGAVLLGVCVLGAYLLLERLRQRLWETIWVGLGSLLALCATPQLWDSPHYYYGVLTNVSATRGLGLWAAPSLSEPLDLALAAAATVLLIMVLRRRRSLWEYVAVVGLVASTLSAARHGVWLLMLLVALLAPGETRSIQTTVAEQPRPASLKRLELKRLAGLSAVATLIAVTALPIVLLRGELRTTDERVVSAVRELAGDRVVLAPAPLVEELAMEGVKIWAGNPLDAFREEDQEAYLDFAYDGVLRAGPAAEAEVVVVSTDSRLALELGRSTEYSANPCGPGWTCFVRGT